MLLSLLLTSLFFTPAYAEFPAPERSTAPISVIYPPEGLSMPLSDGEFIFGSVSQATAPFSINGQTVTVQSNGAFLAWLPISPGTFTFHCLLSLPESATSYARSIWVAPKPEPPLGTALAIGQDALWPKTDMDLRPGDLLPLKMLASPGKKAQYRLKNGSWRALRESSPGLYEDLFMVPADASQEAAPVEYRLSGWGGPKALSRGKISFSSLAPVIAQVKSNSVLRTGPGNGYMSFPTPGIRLVTAGRIGSEYKIALAPALEAWIDAKDIELLPPGTAPPRAVTGAISVSPTGNSSNVRISLSEKVAFQVEAPDNSREMTVRLFNAVGHTNWIIYNSSDTFIQEIRWKQASSGIVEVIIRLDARRTLWGWQASYDAGGLVLEIRRAPKLAAPGESALKGLKVLLDPGHMPSAPGAIGPMGTREMDVNFSIAQRTAELLLKAGAVPILTRSTTDQEVSLAERPRFAVENNADLYVSIHNNALPDGENPFARPRGFSVFYYHPHSLAFAKKMYASYQKHVGLPGEEFRYGNLLVARQSAMPAILTESAYMMIPSQEALLVDPKFLNLIGKTLFEGIAAFAEEERLKQHSSASQAPHPQTRTPRKKS